MVLRQAQYYRDPTQYQLYLESSQFLAVINNEVEDSRNATFAKNLASLENLVLVVFTKDETVIPKESSWFGSERIEAEDGSSAAFTAANQVPIVPSSRDDTPRTIIPMRLQPLYTEDWIGLKTLDEAGKVLFETCEGVHMQLGDCWKGISAKYVGQLV